MRFSSFTEAQGIVFYLVLILGLVLIISYMIWSFQFFTLDVVYREEVRLSIYLSLYTSAISTSVALLLGLLIGYHLVERRSGLQEYSLVLIMLPNALSPAAIGLILLIFFTQTPLGELVNRYLQIVNDPKGILLAQTIVALPLSVGSSMMILQTINPGYWETALTLGFRRLEALFRLIIPMLGKQFMLSAVVIFTRVLGEFGASYILGGGIRLRTETLPIMLFYANNYGDLRILSTVLTIYLLSALAIIAFSYSITREVGRVAGG
ncbi:MAG: ABC transporter permease subunit [Sulfolobales archaeon]